MAVSKVLVVDDEPDMLRACRRILEIKSHEVRTAGDGPEALELLQQEPADLLVLDLRLPSMDGLAVMREARQLYPDMGIVMITAYATLDTAVQAVREGAFDFIPKPFSMEQFEAVVDRCLNYRRLVQQNWHGQREGSEVCQFENVIAQSPEMTAVLDQVRKVAPSEANVLLLGESGTGKELIARALHSASARSRGPFVPLDCASLPESLLETELFGHEKGAFTGATSSRMGMLQVASTGTLFLDEIGNLRPHLQAKLLRILEDRQYRRVGGRELAEVDARFISATNRDLEEMIQEKTFREDLFYRLRVVTIELPPLRERPADVAPLAQSFLMECSDRERKGICGISSAAMLVLQNYSWPGNVRELKNAIFRAVSLAESNQVTPLDLPPELLAAVDPHSQPASRFRQAKQQVVKQFEESYLRQLLADAKGNVSVAARQSGMKRSALHRLLRKHALSPSDFRQD